MCEATPVQDASELSEENLTTINYNTLDALREEDESTPQQSAGRHASQEVGGQLITMAALLLLQFPPHAAYKRLTEGKMASSFTLK